MIETSKNIFTHDFNNINNYQDVLSNSNTLIINLEKKLASSFHIDSKENRFLGFVFENETWLLKDWKQVLRPLNEWKKFTRELKIKTWGEQLLSLTGINIEKKYGVIKQKQKANKAYDIGLNWQVGSKWKAKQLPLKNWKLIDQTLAPKYHLCWQQGMDNLEAYVNWIASCRLIITTDSLGLHLAIALGIPVIAYFSVTSLEEIDHHQSVSFLQFYPTEEYDNANEISLEELQKSIKELLK
ncbi:MAG: hypothetical protein H7281_16040 [Bacteriovorax sp.]|nr:hypothetical protein [Bacteriovorax sp.]